MKQPTRPVSRRTLFAGAGSVAAATAAVSLLPSLDATDAQAAAEPKVRPERGGGYHLSEHVRKYFKTTLV